MQQFQVPQFITVEDRVIGPLTIKQFLYVGGAALLIIGVRTFLQPILFFPVAVFLGALGAALAFLKINSQPLPVVLKNAVLYQLRPRLYIWKKEAAVKKEAATAVPKPETLVGSVPKISESKLSDLAWSLDIMGKGREKEL